jgi:hypothetical protein
VNLGKVLVVSLLAACHQSDGDSSSDASPGDGMSCDAACVRQGWWIGVSSNCNVVCMANPSLTECKQSDCEAVEATRYEDTRKSLAPMLHSAQARSFYLIGSLMTSTYAVDTNCHLQVGSAMPRAFSCTSMMLTLPTAVLTAASSAQATALDSAATANTAGHYTY